MDYSESSSSSDQTSQQIIPKICPKFKQCPFSIKIEYINNQLLLKWDFKNVQAKPSTFSRHIIIIDYDPFIHQKQIFQMVEHYYKYLKLGDFVRVYYIGYKNNCNWIEKTSSPLCQSDLRIKNNRVQKEFKNLWRSVIMKNKKYPQLLSTCIISKRGPNQLKNLVLSIQNLQQLPGCLNIFYSGDDQQLKQHKPKLKPNMFFYDSYENRLKFYFAAFYKIRVISAMVRLKCLNGSIDLRKFANTVWKLQQDNFLVKKIYNLNNSFDYLEKIVINNATKSKKKIIFQIEFEVKSIDNQIFLMSKIFEIQSIINSSCQLPQIVPSQKTQILYHNSVLQKRSKVGESAQQRIVIRDIYYDLDSDEDI